MVLFIGCPCMYNFCSFCHFMAFLNDSFLFDNQYAFIYTLHLQAYFILEILPYPHFSHLIFCNRYMCVLSCFKNTDVSRPNKF